MRESPFTRRGGIETTFGKGNRDIVDEFLRREFTIVQENPGRTEFALRQALLTPFDDGIRHTREGVLLISTLRRSTDPNSPANTLVERWSAYDDPNYNDSAFDAERAFREHIAGSYQEGGVQYENRQKAFRQANLILDRLQRGPTTEKQREELVASTRRAMSKYFSSPIPGRLRTAEQFVRALGLDSKGRQNHPAGRVIVTMARKPVIEDRLIDEIIILKNMHRASLVDTECGFEDAALAQASRFAKTASEISDDRSFNTFVEETLMPNMHYLLSPDVVKMKPYSRLAAKLRFLLFARKGIGDDANDDISMGLARYIGNEAYQFSDEFPFFKTLLTTESRRKRLEDFAELGVEELRKIRNIRDNPPPPPSKKVRETKQANFWRKVEAA